MRQIGVEDAQVGDVLAVPLENAQGRVLLPKGAKLSAAVLARLRGWGISRLEVEGDDLAEPAQSPAEAEEAFEHRFVDCADDPLMQQIKEIARGHLFGAVR
jgi:hypothetical protein